MPGVARRVERFFHQGLNRTQGHGTAGRNMSMKNPVIPPEIEPGTIQLVAQSLNYYGITDPKYIYIYIYIYIYNIQSNTNLY